MVLAESVSFLFLAVAIISLLFTLVGFFVRVSTGSWKLFGRALALFIGSIAASVVALSFALSLGTGN
jgi:hypothetical protein